MKIHKCRENITENIEVQLNFDNDIHEICIDHPEIKGCGYIYVTVNYCPFCGIELRRLGDFHGEA